MKTLYQRFLQKTANTKLFNVYFRLASPYRHASAFRTIQDPRTIRLVNELFPDLIVKNGPFKGLRYPSAQSAGSNLLPKLLGSYEMELSPIFSTILKNNYTDIIDVGSAEGYYAIGFGVRFPKAKIWAFDTDPKANQLCAEMAQCNGVEQRLQIGLFCDAKTLLGLPLGEKALLISDCEGYEMELFTPALIDVLARHDVLIEIHDKLNDTIASTLRERFEKTHEITIIESIDDGKKVRTYQFPELASYDEPTKLFVMREWREWTMSWLYLTSKLD